MYDEFSHVKRFLENMFNAIINIFSEVLKSLKMTFLVKNKLFRVLS
jgi:RNAse (barnase) inhibitor barstar